MLAEKAMAPVPDCTVDKGHKIERLGTSLSAKATPSHDQFQLTELTAVPYSRTRSGRLLLHHHVDRRIAEILTWIGNTEGCRDRGRSAMSACARERPPNRRCEEVIELEHTYIGGDDGRLARFFLTDAKTVTSVQVADRDAAIVALHRSLTSVAFHQGALARRRNGGDCSPSSVLGKPSTPKDGDGDVT
jgi:hypothetical protein